MSPSTTQAPSTHTLMMQGSAPSAQSTAVWLHALVAGSQTSSVQGSSSSQTNCPSSHQPVAGSHASPIVHGLPSSHTVVIVPHSPLMGLQVALLQASSGAGQSMAG